MTIGLDVVYILTNMRDATPGSQLELESKDTSKVMISVEQLITGFEFPPTSYKLDAPLILKYLKAVGQEQYQPDFVPPLAIIAFSLTALSKSVSLPPGTIHASQEVESFRLVPVGSIVKCHARVAQKVDRGKLHLLVIDLEGLNPDGARVVSGRATLILPG